MASFRRDFKSILQRVDELRCSAIDLEDLVNDAKRNHSESPGPTILEINLVKSCLRNQSSIGFWCPFISYKKQINGRHIRMDLR